LHSRVQGQGVSGASREVKPQVSRRKVLLLNPPGEKLYARDKYCTSVSKTSYYWPQVDLLVQSGYLKDHHELFVLDAIAERLSFEESFRRIEAMAADTVIFLTCSASWDRDFAFVKRLKEELGAFSPHRRGDA